MEENQEQQESMEPHDEMHNRAVEDWLANASISVTHLIKLIEVLIFNTKSTKLYIQAMVEELEIIKDIEENKLSGKNLLALKNFLKKDCSILNMALTSHGQELERKGSTVKRLNELVEHFDRVAEEKSHESAIKAEEALEDK